MDFVRLQGQKKGSISYLIDSHPFMKDKTRGALIYLRSGPWQCVLLLIPRQLLEFSFVSSRWGRFERLTCRIGKLSSRRRQTMRFWAIFWDLKNATNWNILIILWIKIGYSNNNNFPHVFEDPFTASKSTVRLFLLVRSIPIQLWKIQQRLKSEFNAQLTSLRHLEAIRCIRIFTLQAALWPACVLSTWELCWESLK
jgi:hypothetical protein